MVYLNLYRETQLARKLDEWIVQRIFDIGKPQGFSILIWVTAGVVLPFVIVVAFVEHVEPRIEKVIRNSRCADQRSILLHFSQRKQVELVSFTDR